MSAPTGRLHVGRMRQAFRSLRRAVVWSVSPGRSSEGRRRARRFFHSRCFITAWPSRIRHVGAGVEVVGILLTLLMLGTSGDLYAADKAKKPHEEALIATLREYVARTLRVEESAVMVRVLALPEMLPQEASLWSVTHISPGKPVGRVLFQVSAGGASAGPPSAPMTAGGARVPGLAGDGPFSIAKVPAEVEVFKEILVASRFLRRNEVLAEGDVMVSPVRLVWADARFLENADLVVGRRVTRPIASRSPILGDALGEPYVVRNGARVTILYLKGPLKVLSPGIAKDDGPVGGRIRVSNADTKKELWGRIVDAETVQVGP